MGISSENAATSYWLVLFFLTHAACVMSLQQHLTRKLTSYLHTDLPEEDPMCFLQRKMQPVVLRSILPVDLKGDALSRLTSCAVVSNSGALLKTQHGVAIDKAEAVFRLNDAPVLGYENQVGSKTYLRFATMDIVQKYLDNPLDVQPGVVYVFTKKTSSLEMLQARHPESSFYYAADEMETTIHDAIGHLYPHGWKPPNDGNLSSWVNLSHGVHWLTTGALAMCAALSMCDTVNAYEMIPSDVASDAPYHYYDNISVNTHFTFQQEHDLWRRLSSTPQVELRRTGVATLPGFGETSCN